MITKTIRKAAAALQTTAILAKINRPGMRGQQGASAIEYVVIAAVVALALFAASNVLDFEGFFENVQEAISGD
ncbi:hypothetical protein BWR19_07835 [Halomonas sp. 1513]|nr:Flp family type IVb pilin [Halomonas sp. 1513]APX92846.1 hypothetical protein BWR19_07835 [Halomonas sp. 1513]